jgi:hypothetical protein
MADFFVTVSVLVRDCADKEDAPDRVKDALRDHALDESVCVIDVVPDFVSEVGV